MKRSAAPGVDRQQRDRGARPVERTEKKLGEKNPYTPDYKLQVYETTLRCCGVEVKEEI